MPGIHRVFRPAVPPALLDNLLAGYDDYLKHYLVSGFSRGFTIGCHDLVSGTTYDNLPSCNDAPHVIDQYVAAELNAGRIAGPFTSPYKEVTKISPIGLVPKKSPGTFRVIHHLSFPAGNSVNDHISKEYTAVQYGSLDDALDVITTFKNPFLAKTDIVNAFRIIPIAVSDTPLLGFKWRGKIYKDCALAMGCASSSQIFQSLSDALVWIVQNKFFAGPIISVLDDFLFIGESRESCERSLTGFEAMCQQLQIPLHPDKTVRPCQSLKFLGVEIDVEKNELRLPMEKIEKARAAVSSLLHRKKSQVT